MSSRTIMIVDDEIQRCELLGRFLRYSGWDVMTATNGKDALKQIKLSRPHVIVLDMNMPEMDGFEVARSMKSDPDLQTTPIIATTRLCGRGDRERR